MRKVKDAADAVKIRPLIKWTGGKYDEFVEFAYLIPDFKNYFEPFFGGGGVFFAIQPKGNSFLNDKSTDLIQFYRFISSNNTLFRKHLQAYAQAWDQCTLLSKKLSTQLLTCFSQFVQHKIDKENLTSRIHLIVDALNAEEFHPLFDKTFIVRKDEFIDKLKDSVLDKCTRIHQIQIKENKVFLKEELLQHVETGVKSGLYLFLRKLTNQVSQGQLKLPAEKASANWYFVREFCYASMFRFNSKGEFNIPYGGIAYNKKNFSAKVNGVFAKPVQQLMANATFYNLDFETFLNKVKPSKNDFVFLDPPYDSEFSEYDQHSFTKDDQVRLRNSISKCNAKCMLVIKETAFIRNLYNVAPFTILDFEKTYTYNVRGRNNRGTRHLIILNYDPGPNK